LETVKSYPFKRTSIWPQYFFTCSIIALTGFEYFFREGALIIPVSILSGIYFLNKKLKFNDKLFLLAGPFVVLSLIQTILGYNRNIFTTIIVLFSFMAYYFIALITQERFVYIFIKIVFVLSVISLVFFSLTYSSVFMNFISTKVAIYFTSLGSKESEFQDIKQSTNILIYNFKDYAFAYNRNSGPFWEPGMFAIFVNVALYFNLIIEKTFFSFRNIIFLLTIITTFSTTGYIALIFALLIYLLLYSKSKLNLVYIFCLIFGAIFIANLDFMQVKILEQLQGSETNGVSRFGAVLVHLKLISEYPITGVGDGASKIISNYTDADSTANGISFAFVKYGIPLGIIYYALLLKACINIMYYYSKKKILGYAFFLLLLILAFSQDITVRHFYLFLICWGLFIFPLAKHSKKYNFALNNL